MKVLRVYADTSVFGGCFDEEFEEESRALFEEVANGRFVLVISFVTLRELRRSPDHVRRILEELPMSSIEMLPDSPEVERLRDAYLQAGVVGPNSADDAEHIAAASVAEVDVVVSWNFEHIVHIDRNSRLRSSESPTRLQDCPYSLA